MVRVLVGSGVISRHRHVMVLHPPDTSRKSDFPNQVLNLNLMGADQTANQLWTAR